MAIPPLPLSSSTTSSAWVRVGLLTTTLAPWADRARASARPMPRPAPVTTATLSLSSPPNWLLSGGEGHHCPARGSPFPPGVLRPHLQLYQVLPILGMLPGDSPLQDDVLAGVVHPPVAH